MSFLIISLLVVVVVHLHYISFFFSFHTLHFSIKMGQRLPTARKPREVDVQFPRYPSKDELAHDDYVGQ